MSRYEDRGVFDVVVRSSDLDAQDGVARQGGCVRAGPGLGVAVDHYAACRVVDRRQATRKLDRLHTRARDVESDQVVAGVLICIFDCGAK